MQIFVPYVAPILTASAMSEDRVRFNKQILECQQILRTIDGSSSAWAHHPIVLQYKAYRIYVDAYLMCFAEFGEGNLAAANIYSAMGERAAPPFLDDQFCDQHKRRLFTKSPDKYPQFACYGVSDENWYFVDGQLLKYRAGKQISP